MSAKFTEEAWLQAIRKFVDKGTFEGRKRTAEEVDFIIAMIAEQTRHCLLCGEIAAGRGIFVPDKPWKYGRPEYIPGKQRLLFYGLCERCQALPDVYLCVENKAEV